MLFKRWHRNLKLEYWKDIEGYEGLYMVSSLGRVKSLGNNKTRKEKILKPHFNHNGYLMVQLHKNGKRKMFLVHRLVAQAFIPNVDNKPCIDHIDTNPLNNNVKNLRWCTSKENMNNPLSLKKMSKAKKGKKLSEKTRKKMSKAKKGKNAGENNPMYGKNPFEGKTEEEMKEIGKKISVKMSGEKNPRARKVKCLETGEIFNTVKEAGEWSGSNGSSITKQIQGKQKSAGKHPITKEKLHWEYVD